jgi:hypothetical protein
VECVVARPPPSAGDVVIVCDNRMTPIGWGVYNPVSMFRVRWVNQQQQQQEQHSACMGPWQHPRILCFKPCA